MSLVGFSSYGNKIGAHMYMGARIPQMYKHQILTEHRILRLTLKIWEMKIHLIPKEIKSEVLMGSHVIDRGYLNVTHWKPIDNCGSRKYANLAVLPQNLPVKRILHCIFRTATSNDVNRNSCSVRSWRKADYEIIE